MPPTTISEITRPYSAMPWPSSPAKKSIRNDIACSPLSFKFRPVKRFVRIAEFRPCGRTAAGTCPAAHECAGNWLTGRVSTPVDNRHPVYPGHDTHSTAEGADPGYRYRALQDPRLDCSRKGQFHRN